MTLMERASAKTPLDASADDALLTSLREKVGQIIPPADAARLIASNPRQARSEISLACERVIAGEPGFLLGVIQSKRWLGGISMRCLDWGLLKRCLEMTALPRSW